MATVELKDIPNVSTLRITCSCRDLGHHIDIIIDHDMPETCTYIEVNTREHSAFHWYGWEKVKALWNLLWNRPICLGGIVVTRQDLKSIVKFLEDNNK